MMKKDMFVTGIVFAFAVFFTFIGFGILPAFADDVPPQTPSGVVATQIPGTSNVLVQWNDNSNDELKFYISRQIIVQNVPSDFFSVAVVGQNTTSYTDTNTAYGLGVCYTVSATNGTTVSNDSIKGCVTPTRIPVSNVSIPVIPVNATKINHAPVITLNGASPVHIITGNTFIDPYATAYDEEDGDITKNIKKTGSVNSSLPGGGDVLYYDVTDSQGLFAAQQKRIVYVDYAPTTSVPLPVQNQTVYTPPIATPNQAPTAISSITATPFVASQIQLAVVAPINNSANQSSAETLNDYAMKEYIALGDSYSAGFGVGPYFDGTHNDSGPNCSRSVSAYPILVANRLRMGINFHACQGAVTNDFYHRRVGNDGKDWGEKPQLDYLNDSTKLVTFTLGGNDIGFAGIVEDCYKNGISKKGTAGSCVNNNDEDVKKEMSALYGTTNFGAVRSYREIFTEIRRRSPKAIVVVVGYPYLYTATKTCTIPVPGFGTYLSVNEQGWINSYIDSLNIGIEMAVKETKDKNFVYVNTTKKFAGHERCGGNSEEWIISPIDNDGPLHPKEKGQAAIADAIIEALKENIQKKDTPSQTGTYNPSLSSVPSVSPSNAPVQNSSPKDANIYLGSQESSGFSSGDRVRVIGSVKVRKTANINGEKIGKQTNGNLGTATDGPKKQGGYLWWKIRYDDGTIGWSVQDALEKYTATPLSQPESGFGATVSGLIHKLKFW